MPISIDLVPGNRAVLLGQTGTGKTHLARHRLLPQTGNLGIIDPKGRFDFGPTEIYETAREILRRKPKRFIYRPRRLELRDVSAHDDVYAFLYDRGNTFIYTDELGSLCRGKHRLSGPPALEDIYCRGRELGITTLTASQRPSRIPIYVLSESQQFYCFFTPFPGDVKRIREMVPGYTGGMPSQEQIRQFSEVYGYPVLGRHCFRYFDSITGDNFTSVLKDTHHAN